MSVDQREAMTYPYLSYVAELASILKKPIAGHYYTVQYCQENREITPVKQRLVA